jgi:DnaJ-class molecular chaperone
MRYQAPPRCHICHGKGIKVNNELKKVTCAKCNGTGLPQPLKTTRVRAKVVKKYVDKNAGMEKLKDVKGV